VLPPEIYGITARLWKMLSPWPLLPFETAKKYGWYITIIGMDDYLVMPVYRNGKPVFYSARNLSNNGGPKYSYQKGAKREYWTSNDILESPVVICEGVADAAYTSNIADSVALLSNWYNGSLDDALAGKRVILALDGDVAGFTGAVRIAHQLRRVTQDVKVLGLPDGLDPTDIALPELKEMLLR
jgi:DNA primase